MSAELDTQGDSDSHGSGDDQEVEHPYRGEELGGASATVCPGFDPDPVRYLLYQPAMRILLIFGLAVTLLAAGCFAAGYALRIPGGLWPGFLAFLFYGFGALLVLIDLIVISVPVIFGYLFIIVFGVITLGLGFLLWGLAWPATVVWALVYYGASLSGPHSATIGMRMMDLEMRTWYGAPSYFVLGAMHAVAFWVSVSFLTPLVLLVGLFNGRRRLLHDIVLGTVVINSSVRNPVVQTARPY